MQSTLYTFVQGGEVGRELSHFLSPPRVFFHLGTWILSLSVSRSLGFRDLVLGYLWPLAYVPALFPHGYQHGENALHTNLDKCPVDKQRHLSFPFYAKE